MGQLHFYQLQLILFGFLKSGICRILGAHKPHRHDKAVPHRWGNYSVTFMVTILWWVPLLT